MTLRAPLLCALLGALPTAIPAAEPAPRAAGLPAIPAAPGDQKSAAPGWLWLLPGGGQFALGQRDRGTAYLAGTASLLAWGGYASGRQVSGELNAPLVYAQQVYVTGIYEAYRDLGLAAGPGGPAPVDPASLSDLTSAPFRWENFKSPWVWNAVVLGAGLNYALIRADPGRRGFRHARRIEYLGDSFNPEWGSAVYTAYWIPISIGAGVSEEALFRGVIQADIERAFNPQAGLWTASTLFGLAHLSRLNSADSWADAGSAGLAGLYLGWRCQKTDYRLAQPIAWHVWFDIAAGLTIFFADPKENPLGARVGYAF